jgi:hypothetical protein
VRGSDHRLGRIRRGEVTSPLRLSWQASLWAARLCIGLVLVWNVQCALAFLIAPGLYAAGFQLAGPPAHAAVRGTGLLFLMWNVPYAVALWHPLRHRVSLYEALVMQAIGLLGESLILLSLPVAFAAARASLARFVAFDAAGLALLFAALLLIRSLARQGEA